MFHLFAGLICPEIIEHWRPSCSALYLGKSVIRLVASLLGLGSNSLQLCVCTCEHESSEDLY